MTKGAASHEPGPWARHTIVNRRDIDRSKRTLKAFAGASSLKVGGPHGRVNWFLHHFCKETIFLAEEAFF
jgi:hypothetical protein